MIVRVTGKSGFSKLFLDNLFSPKSGFRQNDIH